MKSVMCKASAFAVIFLLLASMAQTFHFAPAAQGNSSEHMLSVEPVNNVVRQVVSRPTKIDKNQNGIQDSLETLISQAKTNKSAVLPVVVTLYDSVSSLDLEKFSMLGGRVTYVYEHVAYGFAGVIPAVNISRFVDLTWENLAVVEYDAPLRYHLDVSVPLVRTRPTVWDTYGYNGSPNLSVAILDTGIDDSHSDVGPYGNLDFSKKMVGWYDATSDQALTPEDYGEHGTHVAAIAAGTGMANSLQGSGSVETTFTYVLPPKEPGPWVYGYVDYIDVMLPGVVKLNCGWGGANTVWLILSDPAGNRVKDVSGASSPMSLTYNTFGTSYPTGRYEVFVGNVAGPSGTPFSVTETYPYQGLNDGYNLFAGVAPESKLVGVKVFDNTGYGDLSTLIAGIDWIVQNRLSYHIVVASMSLGLEDGAVDTTLDEKVDSLVSSGIVTTVSAGNDYPSYTIGSPGTAAYVITVAATNDQNGITSYSSNGEVSKNEYGLIKPDVAAPGGTFLPQFGNKIVSADSNDVDAAYTGFADRNSNDYQQMAGTSMAAPHVAGLAALIIQAMGSWDWTLDEALQVKMVICMTASETRSGEETNQPPLNRGEKDSKEGYGRINADAAIEAVTMSYSIGEAAADVLGADPQDKKVWARRVWFSAGYEYEFQLTVPSGADFDLYLYSGSPDQYGQPIIVDKSVQAGSATEVVRYVSSSSDTYYIVVKWVDGDGAFALESTGRSEHDVGVVSVSSSAAIVYARWVVYITVEVKNFGTFNETFDVNAFYGEDLVSVQVATDLRPNTDTTLIFTWNTTGVSPGYYAISANAGPVLGEVHLEDNILTDGLVRVKIPGDVDSNDRVNIFDAIALVTSYGTSAGAPGYNPEADINGDEGIDILDAILLSRHWTG